MRRLQADIDAFARRYGLRSGIESAAILKVVRQALREVLPEILCEDVRAEGYREGVLYLSVPTGSARATLEAYRRSLLETLKSKIGRAKVERLVIQARVSSELVPPD
ncbi:MAG: DciA family protein [Parcubacteria group bacterium]